MVSAAKLRQSQRAADSASAYLTQLQSMLSRALHEFESQKKEETTHPLRSARTRGGKATHVAVVISSQKGLCGAFNANVCKEALRVMGEESQVQWQVLCLGKRGREFFTRLKQPFFSLPSLSIDLDKEINYDGAQAIASLLTQAFLEGRCDKIALIYHYPKGVGRQILRVNTLLPYLDAPQKIPHVNALYALEPDTKTMLDILLPWGVRLRLYQALCDSYVAEHAARMMAMDKATENASELLGNLRLTYNRTRQANITREILEIVSGSNALQQ